MAFAGRRGGLRLIICSDQGALIETKAVKVLLVTGLRATGRQIYAINPLAAARYRDRGSVSRAKSDAADARVLANILRTDRHAHRPTRARPGRPSPF